MADSSILYTYGAVYHDALSWYSVHMQPLIKEYLKTHSFQQLEDEHGVCVRFSNDGTKFSANYDQILAKNGDPLTEQCRGMVLRPTQFDKSTFGEAWKDAPVGDVEVLAWPMNRFYNHGDPAAADVDWSDPGLRVYEKLDGTMIVLYWDPLYVRWCAATRSVSNADFPIFAGHMEIGDATFSDLFLRALVETRKANSDDVTWEVDGFDKVVHLNKEVTYVFELTSQFNRIVVKYDAPRATLLAARVTKEGFELPIEDLRLQHVQRPKTWELKDPTALAAFIDSADPAVLEGAVVCDSQFRRLKVKNKAWVMSSRAKEMVSSSPRTALECIILEKLDDVIPLVEKDIADKMLAMQDEFLSWCRRTDARFDEFKVEAAGSRKRFAEQVMLSGDWTAPYFQLWENRAPDTLSWVKMTSASGKLHSTSLDIILSKMKG